MVKPLERYLLRKTDYRYLYDKKPKLSHSVRNILSIVFMIASIVPFLYFFNIFSGMMKINNYWFIMAFFSLIISIAAFTWFRLNCREMVQDSLKKISTLKDDNKHDQIVDEIDKLLDVISDWKDGEYSKFNEIVLRELGNYIALFIYPILQSNNNKARYLVYTHFIPNLTEIIKDKNKLYEIPELIKDFDTHLMRITNVKESIFLLYGLDNDFLKLSIQKRIYMLKELVERIPPIQRIIKYIKRNTMLSTYLILIFVLIVLNLFFPSFVNINFSIP